MNLQRKFKIAHFGRYGEGDTDVVKSILLSLKRLGHEVQEWDVGAHPEWLLNPEDCKGPKGPVIIRLDRVKKKLLDFGPDFIICNAGGLTFSQKSSAFLKRNNIPILGITLSDPDIFEYVLKYGKNFTWFTTNSQLAYENYKKYGFTNVLYMPFGIDFRFFKEREANKKFLSDVAIIGHGREDRYPIAKKLCESFNTKLYGKRWGTIKELQGHSMGSVRGEEWFQAAYSTKMLVNFPRTVEGYTNVKVGILEAAATGKLLFTEYFDEMENLFNYGEEIIGYSSSKDLVNKINYYLKNEEEAKQIGKRAMERCKQEHTWERRFEGLFNMIGLYQ
ncbi:CgeB family protein [Pontibacillus yanchengensis]|uniref:Spore maturation protein n=1 Tax=Pontibacillus yanchengensis Y32 TaxID=1385514 RepID=A0A0A2T747_9BACI|nr:glycosyltransferase [Pontibacillus yanchengensis]KGP71637.1 spore maturation protein [Pontibacillus yanchengensis Y32]